MAQRPSGSARRAAPRRKPSVDTQATIDAHTMIEIPRKPARYPIASTNGYVRLVFPLENPLPSDHSKG